MTKANQLIKTSSLIYLIGAFAIIPYETLLGGMFLTVGILLLSYSFLNIEELVPKKGVIAVLAFFAIFLGIIPAIFLFMAVDEISSYKQNSINSPPDDEITSEAKRIDLLLKIGLGMVIISGILFATSTWESFPDILKLFILILMGVGFLGLSRFSENTLRIEKTTKAYYILGLTFFLLTWIGIGVFGSISPWLTYTGEGKNLVYFITFFLLALCLHLVHYKFDDKEYKYFEYISYYLCLYHILAFMKLDLIMITLIVTIISFLINYFYKKDQMLLDLNQTLSYLYFPVIITTACETKNILVLITSFATIFNLLYLGTKTKNQLENIASVLISYVLITTSILNLELSSSNIIIFIFNSLLYLLINHNKINREKHTLKANQLYYNIASTIVVLSMEYYNVKFIIFAFFHLVINCINCYITNKEDSIYDLRYQPFSLFIAGLSIFNCFESFDLSPIYLFAVIIVIYAVIDYLVKEERITKVYFTYLFFGTILTLLFNMGELNIFASIVLTLLSIYIYFDDKDNNYIYYYVLMLLSILNLTNSLKELGISSVLTNLLLLGVYGSLTYKVKNKNLHTANLIALVLPLYGLVNCADLSYEIQLITDNIFSLYILFLIVTLIAKTDETKDTVSTIGTAILSLTIIFEQGILIGLYLCLLGAGILVYTSSKKKYKKLFYTGVAITIINILVQLSEFWSAIPPWLYLLLIGISIIGFVTYKEKSKLDNKNNPQPPKEKPKIIVEEPKQEYAEKTELLEDLPLEVEKAEFCPYCGTKNPGGNFCLNCGQNLIISKKKNK